MRIIEFPLDNIIIEPCVQTIGFFDGVHCGHRYLLKQVTNEAARQNLKSMVVTFKQHPRNVLHPEVRLPLLTTLPEKLRLIEQCGIDYVALLDFTPQLAQTDAFLYMKQILRDKLHGKSLVIGYDHHFGKRDGKGFLEYQKYGNELGINVVQALPLPTLHCPCASSTAIRNTLADGDIKTANTILGRPYSISGTVTHGQALGRTIGFPTANITPDSTDKLIPKPGVYATSVTIGDTNHRGMLYIGTRPSVNNCSELRIEVNLLDFNEEIYNMHICANFLSRIRDEKHFDSLDQLRAQLAKDRELVATLIQ